MVIITTKDSSSSTASASSTIQSTCLTCLTCIHLYLSCAFLYIIGVWLAIIVFLASQLFGYLIFFDQGQGLELELCGMYQFIKYCILYVHVKLWVEWSPQAASNKYAICTRVNKILWRRRKRGTNECEPFYFGQSVIHCPPHIHT